MAKECGVDVLKYQFFPDTKKYTECGNIPTPLDWWEPIWKRSKEVDLPITASVFDPGSLDMLSRYNVPFIKLGYSIGFKKEWIEFLTTAQEKQPQVVVTCDVMNDHLVPDWCIKLWTHTIHGQTVYPVHTELKWDGLFPRFDGFSDHTLGVNQALRAKQAGATWIEKHMTLDHPEITAPDAKFALFPKEMKALCSALK